MFTRLSKPASPISRRLVATLALLVMVVTAGDALAKRSKSAKSSASTPMTLVVDLAAQRVRGYRGTRNVWSSFISSGKRGHRTPTGVFSIIQKRSRHFSNLYNNAPMPHMQRLTWSGIAFHGGPIPGYPASHGCVRLPYGQARSLFRKTNMRSTRVIVTYGAPRPTAISHALLPNRLPATVPAVQEENGAPTKESDQVATRETTTLMNSVIGVSSARAAVGSAVRGSRSTQPARSRAEVIARLDTDVDDANAAFEAAKREVTLARAATEQEASELRALNIALRKASIALRRAQQKASAVTRQHGKLVDRMKRLMTANVELVSADQMDEQRFEKLVSAEYDLDRRLTELVSEHDVLHGEVVDLRKVIDALKPAVRAKNTAYRSAKRAQARAVQTMRRASAELKTAEHVLKRHKLPVHVLISRSKSRLYVRQGYKDIYATDVTFADADRAIGTHVFTAVRQADDGETLAWTTITVPDRKYRKSSAKARTKSRKSRRNSRFSARDALDRVELPDTAAQKLRELVKVGSSIIVSDRGPSIETGKGTDFIVLTR